MVRMRVQLRGLIAVALLALPAALPARAADQAVIVLDHSHSMWGQIDEVNKVVHMRNALTHRFGEYQGKLDLGLVSFGHGKEKGCDDIATLKPVGAIDAEADGQLLETVRPKGVRPIAAALDHAGSLLRAGGRPQSVILISNGLDTCKGDPCAAAEALKKKDRLLSVHVVGFDTHSAERLQDLQCIADFTGGEFRTAANGQELDAALGELLAAAASAGNRLAALPAAATPRPDGPPVDPNLPGSVGLSAFLAEGGQQLYQGLIWRVYDGRVQEDGRYRLVSTHREARPVLALAPGDYLVSAAYGLANVTKRLTVWPGQSVQDTFILNAGGLRLYATVAKKPLVSEHALRFDLYSEETDQLGNRRRIVAGAKPGVIIRLNSGIYHVVSSYGDGNAVVEADLIVEPGKLTEAAIDHRAGKITFRLVDRPGGEALADTDWSIFTTEGTLVKKSAGAFPSHILGAGDYEVTASHGGREVRKSFSVSSGDVKQIEVVLP